MKKENIKYIFLASLALYFIPCVLIAAAFLLSRILPGFIMALAYVIAAAIFPYQFGKKLSSFKKLSPPKSPVLTWLPAFIPVMLTPIVCLIVLSFDFSDKTLCAVLVPRMWSIIFYTPHMSEHAYMHALEDRDLPTIAFAFLPQMLFEIIYGFLFVLGEFRERQTEYGKSEVKYAVIFGIYIAVSAALILAYSNYAGISYIQLEY